MTTQSKPDVLEPLVLVEFPESQNKIVKSAVIYESESSGILYIKWNFDGNKEVYELVDFTLAYIHKCMSKKTRGIKMYPCPGIKNEQHDTCIKLHESFLMANDVMAIWDRCFEESGITPTGNVMVDLIQLL